MYVLAQRFRLLFEQLSTGPGESIPLVCQDWANTKAAYRFLDNERVSEADILAGHFQATRERVTEAFNLIHSNKNVRAILVNIFGGIVRCDMIAEGIIHAVQDVGVRVPVVVRIEGTNAERGRELLAKSGLAITAASDLTDAANKVVAAAKGKK